VLPRLDGLTVDGTAADWAGRGLHLPFLTPDSDIVPDATRSHASARLAWDDTGLLVLVEVTDTTPSESHYAAGAYECDSVELFLAPDPARSESVQWVFSPGRDPVHPAPRIYPFDNRPISQQSLSRDAEWAVRPHTTGYTLEARLPWACLGATPKARSIVATRLFVNDLVAPGQRTRFAWQPAPGEGRFFRLVLGPPDASSVVNQSLAWLSMDPASTTLALNVIAPPDFAGDGFVVHQEPETHGTLNLLSNGPVATGSLVLPARRPNAPFALTGPDRQTLELPDTLTQDVVSRIVRATTGWRIPASEKSALAFAHFGFAQHLFTGSVFPAPAFVDPARVARLLGASPSFKTIWLNADGRPVTSTDAPGLYAARTEVTLPGRTSPWTLEHILLRLPDGATVPSLADVTAALQLGFGLQGADATPTQAARTAERWWHGIRRTNGWSQALPFELRVPTPLGDAPRPLLVYLHGTGQQGKGDAQKMLTLLASLAPADWILAYPQSTSAWRGPDISELIDTIAASHCVDPNRIYLVGFSMGGIRSWEVALDEPNRFAAVVPTGGRMGCPADAPRLRNVPVWVFNGEDDPGTTCEEAQLMVDALTRAGGKPTFTRLPGKSHGDSQEAALRYPGLFDWLQSQRRLNTHP
jgi:predicted esterase